MARQPLDAPGPFARLVAAEIRREIGDLRWSGRKLATELGRSEKYVRDRLNGTFEFSLNDIESFADIIHVPVDDFLDRIEILERAEQEQAKVTELRPRVGGASDDGEQEADQEQWAAGSDRTEVGPEDVEP